MRAAWIVTAMLVLFGPSAAQAKDTQNQTKEPAVAAAGKEPAKETKAGHIKDVEAVRYVQKRLEADTGLRGWKVELKDGDGPSKEFKASLADRTEKGSVNLMKNYPNQGVLRVYLVPRD